MTSTFPSSLKAQARQSQSRQNRRKRAESRLSKLEKALALLPFDLSFDRFIRLVEYQVHTYLKNHPFINNYSAHAQLKQDTTNQVIEYFCTDQGMKYISSAYNQSYLQMVARSRAIDYLVKYTRHTKHEVSLVCFEASNDDLNDQINADKLSYLSLNDDVEINTDISFLYERASTVSDISEKLIFALSNLPKLRRSIFIMNHWDELVLICEHLDSDLYNRYELAKLIHTEDSSIEEILDLMSKFGNGKDRFSYLLEKKGIQSQAKIRQAINAFSQNLSRARRSVRNQMSNTLA